MEKFREISIAEDPQKKAGGDPWKDFRQIEKVQLDWEFSYRHSLGKCSKFFIELEHKRLFGSECPKCGQVWMPPRPVCPDDLTITTWKQLSGRGALHSFSVSHARIASFPFETPYVVAYIALDGASTLCLYQLRNYGDVDQITLGMRVKVAYSTTPAAHPLWSVWFEPEEAVTPVR